MLKVEGNEVTQILSSDLSEDEEMEIMDPKNTYPECNRERGQSRAPQLLKVNRFCKGVRVAESVVPKPLNLHRLLQIHM
jgi:hypothetical protein